jgi:hypothetical protein
MSRELPLGAIKPRGWLLNQLNLQKAGLTGALEDIWSDVGAESGWKGGGGENWERGPYYLDGLIALAGVLDDDGLRARAQPWFEWMLGSQDDTGFFGPIANRDWWPRMVALKALTQYAETVRDERVIPFLGAYFRYQLRTLPTQPLSEWARARGADNILSVWWLYDRTAEAWLLDLVDLLDTQTADWETYLVEDLITGPATSFDHFTHGPNVAMGLKTGAIAQLRDGDPRHRGLTEASLANLDRWHGQVHGWFSGDEWLNGREPTAGLETCQVVESMFTMEVLSRAQSTGLHGDRLEMLAFNLLAAACDGQMLAHQYHQQANQIEVSVARRPWSFATDDCNVFGLEPNFGCCTANLHQGWPKFVRSLWLVDPHDTLRVVAYAPCIVTADLASPVSLVVDTDYPFDDSIIITVNVANPANFALRLRIPHWCADPTMTIAGADYALAGNVVDGYVEVRREWADGDTVHLRLPMRPRVERRERQAAGVRLGPLIFSLQIGENWQAVADAPGLAEWHIFARGSWNYALDVSSAADWTISRRPVGAIPFAGGGSAVTVIARGAQVRSWTRDGAQAGAIPNGPVLERGPMVDLQLIPYGNARIRVTELPTTSEHVSPS